MIQNAEIHGDSPSPSTTDSHFVPMVGQDMDNPEYQNPPIPISPPILLNRVNGLEINQIGTSSNPIYLNRTNLDHTAGVRFQPQTSTNPFEIRGNGHAFDDYQELDEISTHCTCIHKEGMMKKCSPSRKLIYILLGFITLMIAAVGFYFLIKSQHSASSKTIGKQTSCVSKKIYAIMLFFTNSYSKRSEKLISDTQ